MRQVGGGTRGWGGVTGTARDIVSRYDVTVCCLRVRGGRALFPGLRWKGDSGQQWRTCTPHLLAQPLLALATHTELACCMTS